MKPGIFSLLLLLCVSACGAFAAEKTQAQGQLLDQDEYQCANCAFGAASHYYCFEADNRILIGFQKTPTLNWMDSSKNYLTKVHKAWKPWTPDGGTVKLSYDKKHIWVTRPNGKTVRLKQDYRTDIFTNTKCRSVVKKSAD